MRLAVFILFAAVASLSAAGPPAWAASDIAAAALSTAMPAVREAPLGPRSALSVDSSIRLPAPDLPPSAPVAAGPVTAAVPAASFFPVLPLDAPDGTEPQLVPVASNHPLREDPAGLTRAVIVVHDFSRDAGHALALMTALAGAANTDTMIIAPQFLIEPDIARFAAHLPDGGRNFARWPYDSLHGVAWKQGGDSVILAQKRGISSFTVLDLLILYLSDRRAFPDLRQIVVAGHGDGADFVQRYAAVGQAPDVIDQRSVTLRFVVSDASSYLYLTAGRPLKTHGFGRPDAQACPAFNAWPYGLDDLPPYARRVGANAIKLRYVSRPVSYLSGTAAGQNDPDPDTSCGALAEGFDRAARAAGYAQYLPSMFGEAASRLQSFAILPNIGDDPVALYGSNCGMTQLFGDGRCAALF